ncbi:MAG: AIPR family protein [Methanophagales archaeon]|nr:AIPR family protein [Methanophagales archaeon]
MRLNDNDIIVLDSILKEKKKQTADSLSDSDFFEIFTFEQLLKNYDLTYEDLFSGKVGGVNDGGIDGFFTFIDKELLNEDTDIGVIGRNPIIEVFLTQAKRSPSFSESAVDRVNTTVADIFNLSNTLTDFKSIYNESLINKANTFRKTYLDLAARHPELKIYYVYASKGDTLTINRGIENRAKTLEESIKRYFHGVTAEIKFFGARELLDASRLEKSYTLQLRFLENYISKGDNNYVILSSLKDLFKFVTDENGNLRRYIFESNVRDYQGNVEVNKDIRYTLESDDKLDFWWLNNGITILASKASVAGKTITLDDVQVVNGLQTTTIIYNYFKEKDVEEDNERSILIRIIVTEDAEARDRIIKATNFQTAIPIASLKATDRIHRNIEDYFLQNGWFYDRRKNYYKNIGKPVDRIISIPYLAQAVMAIILREADNARARPSSLIKSESNYARVFSESISPDIYLFCAKVMKRIDNYLRDEISGATHFRTNFKFHLAMLSTIKLLGKKDYRVADLTSISEENFSDKLLLESLDDISTLGGVFSGEHGSYSIERVAKSKEFVEYLIDNMDLSSSEVTER